jgi:alpha-tubulin suppressor-like RCC1 family protein
MRMTAKKIIVSFIILLWMQGFVSASIQHPSDINTTRLSIPFLENQGILSNDAILFYAKTFAGTVQVYKNGDMFFYSQSTGQRFIERISGARPFAPIPGNQSDTSIHLFYPHTLDTNNTQAAAYNYIMMPDIYPQISMKLRAYGRTVEKIFIVNPGGHPNQIKVHVDGANALETSNEGQLLVLPQGIRYSTPKAYQIIDGKQVSVNVCYLLENKTTYGFHIGQYNTKYPLFIDPFIAGTFFGGDNADEIKDVAVASNGDVYVAGTTTSDSIPISKAASGYLQLFDPISHKEDVFIARFNSDLSTLLSATFIGGTEPDTAKAIAIDVTGNIIVCGQSLSSDFPIAQNYKGEGDIFVIQMNNDLSNLLSAKFFGGSKQDMPQDLVINPNSHEIYIAGYTQSGDFDQTQFQTFSGITDAFVARLNHDLSRLESVIYLGGSNDDKAFALQLNSFQNVYVVGQTYSSDFIVKAGSYDVTHNGNMDGFVCEITKNLGVVNYATFLGGAESDIANAIIVDNDNHVYVAGTTSSENFPIANNQNTYDSEFNGTDIFVARFDVHLENLETSTYIGGTNWENAKDMAFNNNNEIMIAGITGSSDFPATPGTFDQNYNGAVDTFIATMNPDLTTLSAATYLGNSSDDMAESIAMQNDNIVIAGTTWSSNLYLSNTVFDSSFGEREGFISILSQDLGGTLRIVSDSDSIHVTMSEGGIPTDFSLSLTAVNDLQGEIYWNISTLPAHGDALASGPGTEKSITYTPHSHWYGTDSFIVQISDKPEQYQYFDRIPVYVHVLPVPDAPVFTVPGQVYTVKENSFKDYTFGVIEATDPDVLTPDPDNNSLTFSIISGNLGEAFKIVPSTGVLAINNDSAVDFEQHETFFLEIAVANQSYTSTNTFKVIIINQNDAPTINKQQFTLLENSPVGTLVGNVIALDADGNTLYYKITGNNYNTFAIAGLTGDLTVSDNEKLNFEGELKTFDLDIEVSDGTYTASAVITIVLTDDNDRPIILDQSFSTNENNVTSNFKVLANDADNNPLTYEIIAGNEGGAFTINEQTGLINVQNINQLDYELYHNYLLTVEVNDGTYTQTATITITLNNLNDNPPSMNNQTFHVNENSEGGTIVGTVVATDPDQLFLYYRISKPLDNPFLINTNSGLLTVNAGNFLDCETTCAYTITVAVSDGKYTTTGLVIVELNDINESAPRFTKESFSFSVKENSIANTLVGQATAIDGDPGDQLIYSIVSGNSQNLFLMDAQTGNITVHVGADLDREKVRTYVLGLKVSDGINTDTANAEVRIENINDNAPVVENQTWYINENTPNGTIIGTVIVNDPDEDTQSYSIKSGNTNFAFAIIEANGNIMVNDEKQLDYEFGPKNFILTIVTSDGIFSDEGIIVINIRNTNDNTPLVKNQTFYVDENKHDNTWIGTIVANDDDPADTITYEIISGNTDNAFKIDSQTGKLSVNGDQKLNYENINQYELLVQVSDGTNVVTAIVLVILNEKNDPPTVSDQIFSVEENQPVGTVIGTVSAKDDDVGDTLSFSISAGNENNPFEIDSQGNISIKDSSRINYEILKIVNLVVTVTDGEIEAKASIVVNVKDANDPPVITNQSFNIDEDSINTSYVGTVVASDEDRPLNILTFNILSGNDNNAFVLHETTGVMRVNNTSVIDYEKQDQFILTVQVDDGQARQDSEITINIRNTNDNPPQAEDLSVTINENQPEGYAIGHVVATDADNDVLSYRILSGNTNNVFAFSDTNSPTITVRYGNLLDYEQIPEYHLVVEVSDKFYQKTVQVIVTVNNLNDNVPVIQQSTLYVNENAETGFNLGKVFTQDLDGDPLSYSIVQAVPSNPFRISPTTGELYVQNSLNYESDPAYTLTVLVSDGVYSASAPIKIVVNNVNDNAPLVYDQTFTIKETAENGDEVGQLVARDLDNDIIAYYFNNPHNVFEIDPGTGIITVIEDTSLNNDITEQYELSINVKDNVFTSYAVLTILVIDGNNNDVVFDQSFSVQENSPQDTLLGKIAVDAPPGSRQFMISSGNSNDAFTLDPDTGELTVNKPSELNYELIDTYILRVIATINGIVYHPTLTVNIMDANEYPPIFESNSYHFYVNENSINGTPIGVVHAHDLDSADILKYETLQGNPYIPFNLELNSGQLTVNEDYQLNYEHVPAYTLTVSVTDGKHFNETQVLVSLNDMNEFPPIFSSETYAYTIAENIATGSYIGKIAASDEDPGSVLIYQITAGNDQRVFQIDNTGNFSIDDADGLDFETQSAYTLTVQISDGMYNDTSQIIVTIKDINDAPEILLSLYPRIPSIRGGSLHSVVLNNSGQVFTFGENQHGQLGDDTMIDKKIPVPIFGTHDFVKIDSKYLHTIALQNDSSVWTWGWNNNGQLGNGDITDLFAPTQVDGLTRVKDIVTGANHTMVLLYDGSVKVWGNNSYGQLGDGTQDERHRPVSVINLENIKSIAAGHNHSLAILNDNTVKAWGQNNAGQVGDNTFNNQKLTPVKVSDLVNVISLSAGKEHSMALKKNGTVWTWGANVKGQLGIGTTQNQNHPILVEPLSDIVAIAAGGEHSLALQDDGTIWIWGLNNQGQLGNGTMLSNEDINYETNPIKVNSNETFIAIAAGENHSMALSADGTVWAWGDNSKGQLGDNSIQNALQPQKVNAPNNLEPLNIGQQEPPRITIQEDNQSEYLFFEIRDAETSVQDLSVTAEADDPVLVPMDQININCTDGQCQAMISPSQNDNGETLVHFRVNDGEKSSVSSIKLVVEATNDPPFISEIDDQRTDENITSSAISFKIDDLESSADNLILTPRSSNLSLVPEDQIVFGGSGKNRFVTITPGDNQSGQAVITITVRDQSEATSQSFNFTVNAAPDISDIGDITIGEDQSTGYITFEVSDSESDFSELTIVGFASDPNIVPDQNIQVNCTHTACTLLIKPNPDQSGKTLITLRVSDGNAVSEDTFLLTIEPGNDPPVVEIDLEAGNPAIAAGDYHSLAVRGGNEVMTWGRNELGQLGIGVSGEDKNKTFPIILNDMEKIVALAAGENHSLALSNDGNVWSWGNNRHGQLGIGNFEIIQKDTPQNVLLLTDIMTIDAGAAHSLALQSNGYVWSWGKNSYGQLGNGTSGQETSESKPLIIADFGNCVAIAAGHAHSVALKNDGTVFTWGFNNLGQLGDQSNLNKNVPVAVPGMANVIAIAAGDTHTVALKNDGTVWTWGDNAYGQLGDGTIVPKNTPVRVLDISNVIGIAAGYGHTLALRNDGTVWGWGFNEYGQLGDNNLTQKQTRPVKADIFPQGIAIAAGRLHSLVLKSDGSVWSFGANGYGQLGNNSLQGTELPIQVNGPNNIDRLDIGTPYTIDEDDQTEAIIFSVTDEETPSEDLDVTVSSSNPSLVPDSGFILGGTGKIQSLIIRPAKDQFGKATITVKAYDGLSFSTDSFTLWVNEINDGPKITDIDYQMINEDTQSSSIPFQISDLETPADQLLVSATSSNAELIPNSNIQIVGTGKDRTAIITPASDMNGTATITIEVSDGIAVAADTFEVRVMDINDAPEISPIEDQTTDEDTPSQEIAFTISDMETPAANLFVTASTSDDSIVPVSNLTISGIDENRSIIITPMTDQNGTVQITLNVSDGYLSSQESFNFNIFPVDDEPHISPIENQETWEYVVNIPIAFTITDAETPADDLLLTAVSSDSLIVHNDNITFGGSGINRTIYLEPSEDQFGTTDITIAVSDGNNTKIETFSLTVNPQRDWDKNEDIVTYSDLKDIWGRSSNDIFAVGNGGAIFHYNGISWRKVVTTYDYDFNAVWGDVGMVYVVGNNGVIVQYNGHSWSKMNSGTSEHLNGIWGNGRSVFAVGTYGTILKFNDVSWTDMASGTTTTLLDIWGNENNMYAVGNGGMVLQYNGYAWDTMSKVTAYSLRGVWGSSENDVFAVGDGGTIIHYNGTEWIEQERGNFSSLKGIWGLSGNKVFATGLQGTIVLYNGETWAETETGVAYPLMNIWGASITDIFVVGENGTILRRSTGQISGKITTTITGGSAIVVGASVSIVETGQQTTTDENGRYVFDNVPIGAYTVKVTSEHFEEITISDIRVPGGEIAIPDIALSDLKTGVYSQAELDNAVYKERIKYDPDGDGVISTENVIYFLQWLGGF